MTQFSWNEQYEKAVILFGGARADSTVEEEILGVFREHPQTVVYEIDRLGERIAKGQQVNSPWHLLRHILRQKQRQPSNETVSDDTERERQIVLAERWLRTAGMHFDRWPEVEDALFGHLGRLAPFDGVILREAMRTTWLKVRRTGERLEWNEKQRAHAYKKIHQVKEELKRKQSLREILKKSEAETKDITSS